MRRRRWLILLLPGLLSLAFAAVEGDESERNRRRLEKWKADPEQYQRLQRDLAAFYALPAERQESIRALDRYIHEAEPTTQARLWAVLERYSVWLEKLPEAERRAVLEAPTAEGRLAVIHGLRQREWVQRLPRTIRDDLDRLPADQRVARITHLRLEEQRQRVLWQRTLRGKDDQIPRPTRMSELPAEVQSFVKQQVLPRLSKQDDKLLRQSDGKWPEYPRTVSLLADRYPVLPVGPLGKITRPEELPESLRPLYRPERFKKGKGSMSGLRLQNALGKWPDFALVFSEMLGKERGTVALGASRLDEFPDAIQTFVRDDLMKVLSMTEQQELAGLEGRWPEYPRRLLLLARRHQKVIPGMSLPGPPEIWAAARVAKQELSDEQRASIELIASDPQLGRDNKLWKGLPIPKGKKKPRGPGGLIKDGR